MTAAFGVMSAAVWGAELKLQERGRDSWVYYGAGEEAKRGWWAAIGGDERKQSWLRPQRPVADDDDDDDEDDQ